MAGICHASLSLHVRSTGNHSTLSMLLSQRTTALLPQSIMQIKPFQHCLRYAAQTRVPLVSQARYLTVTSRARQHESPVFSAGSDASELTTMLDELVSPNGQWTLSEGGRGVERHYKFKTFKATWVRSINRESQSDD